MVLVCEIVCKGVIVNMVLFGYCDMLMVVVVVLVVCDQIVVDILVGWLGLFVDIVCVVVFFVVDDVGYIIGVNLLVNGGYFMSF